MRIVWRNKIIDSTLTLVFNISFFWELILRLMFYCVLLLISANCCVLRLSVNIKTSNLLQSMYVKFLPIYMCQIPACLLLLCQRHVNLCQIPLNSDIV